MSEPTRPAEPVRSEREASVLWLTLNRPERLNAVSQPLYEELAAAVEAADADPSVRALVLTGAGRAFCAGADLKAHAEEPPGPEDRRRYARAAQLANRALQRCGKPVVAAVNGAAVGAGLELALSCDFIVVAENARLRLPELALGTFFGGGVAHTLPERVGVGSARALLLLGEFFDGRHAGSIGLADIVVEGDAVTETARALAGRLAKAAPRSVRLAKRLLRRAPRLSRRTVMREEERALIACMGTADWAEGLAAFAAKREPRFSGE